MWEYLIPVPKDLTILWNRHWERSVIAGGYMKHSLEVQKKKKMQRHFKKRNKLTRPFPFSFWAPPPSLALSQALHWSPTLHYHDSLGTTWTLPSLDWEVYHLDPLISFSLQFPASSQENFGSVWMISNVPISRPLTLSAPLTFTSCLCWAAHPPEDPPSRLQPLRTTTSLKP